MPLFKSKSKKAVGKNIEVEMEAGKPHKQALAIALSVRRQAMKKAHGGVINPSKEGYDSTSNKGHLEPKHDKDYLDPSEEKFMSNKMASGGMVCAACGHHNEAMGGEDVEGPATNIKPNIEAKSYSQEENAESEDYSHSGEIGDEEEKESENKNDKISKMRKFMKKGK